MANIKFLLVGLLAGSSLLQAQPTDLFISEYIEGSSFNKALELYNGTALPIDLGAGQYALEVYFNGSLSSTSVALTGTVPAGGVFILAHPSALLPVAPDMTTTVVNFNGDDAVVLRRYAPAQVLDVIGQVGFDPGTQWGANDTSTLDRSLRRKPLVCQGDPTLNNAFYTEPQWDGFPLNTFAGLGAHSVSCGSSAGGLSLSPSALAFSSAAGLPSTPQPYAVSGTSLTAPVAIVAPPPFEVALASNGPFSSSLSIPSASFSNGPLTVYARFVPLSVGSTSATVLHSSAAYSASAVFTGTATGITPIAQIQGTAAASSYSGQLVSTQGVVTGDFQAAGELGGFFIQDPVGDGDPLSAEGLFVSNTSFAVSVGDMVLLSGTVQEYFGKTRLMGVTALSITGVAAPVNPVAINLPFASAFEAERWEGMRVVLTQTLTVSEVYALGRYGEVLLSANGRLQQPTSFIDPNDLSASGTSTLGTSNVAAVAAQQQANTLRSLLLDDGSNLQNPPVTPFVDAADATLRCGSTISGLSGILDYDFGVYRIQPLGTPQFSYAPRPAVPSIAADVKVASFNVLNYFNGNGLGAGFPTSRGADTPLEFSRQRTKIIEAIRQIDAAVVGLMEMENDGNGSTSAIQDLVDGLNAATAPGTYTFVPDPLPANGGTGTDEIKVALLYQPARVGLVGNAWADSSPAHNRPPLAQSFSLTNGDEKFSVVVCHFKSKGCGGASGSNADQNDGQGCYNAARRDQAQALLAFAANVVQTSGDDDVLLIGDFNAYHEEDPLDVLVAGGYSNLLPNSYSYVFQGQAGALDHAFASPALAPKINAAAKWHINADEPLAKDYNQEFNPAYLYQPGPYRSSDHDPLIIGWSVPVNTLTLQQELTVGSPVWSLFPSPSTGEVNLRLYQPGSFHSATLCVSDASGRLLVRRQLQLGNGMQQLSVALHELTEGFYLVELLPFAPGQLQKLIIKR